MAGTAWPFNETGTSGVPAYTARQLRQLNVAPFVAMGSAARPLGAKSGVRVGTPASIAMITGSGPYSYSIAPFAGVIDGESNAAAGPYSYSFAASETGSITAAGAAARKDRLDVQISDSDEGDGSGAKSVTIVYTQGAATGGALPAAPARSHALAVINVPTSGAPTISWVPEWSGWQFNTLAELTAYTTLITDANVPASQVAKVVADPTTTNNGDYLRLNSTWLPPFATVTGTLAGGSYTAYLTRTGYIVHLYMTVVSTSVINLTTASVLLVLPSTLTPARQEYSQMGTLPSDFLFSVNPNGNVMASQTYTGVPSGSRFLFNLEYSLV